MPVDADQPLLVRYSEQPELWDDGEDISAEVWPEYNLHGDVLNACWGRLFEVFPDWQFALIDRTTGTLMAEGHTAPCPWDGRDESLGDGIDDAIRRAIGAAGVETGPRTVCALAAEIRPAFQGQGLAARLLDGMAAFARDASLPYLIAPVRPSQKERYPLTPIERYVSWRREDGRPFDPWIRVHTRRGGRIAAPIPRSMRITGTVPEWESWTGMAFPESGEYTFPRGLAPLHVDCALDRGCYWEPNVWIVHAVA